MENQFNQLRFDISEKVRLHPQQPGINTLLELDLYPDVEIKDEGQHLKIQGYLRLNGVYTGEGQQAAADESGALHNGGREEETNELAYVIPVEITLPADRAEQSRISAEVEAFDYEVLSPFELNIEAILMIDGLLPESSSQDEEEQTTAERKTDHPVFSGSMAQPLTVSGEEKDKKETEDEDNLKANVKPLESQEEEEKTDAREITGTGTEASEEKEEQTKAEEKQKETLKPAFDNLSREEDHQQEEKEENEKAAENIHLSPEDFWYERQKTKAAGSNQKEDAKLVKAADEEKSDEEKSDEEKSDEEKADEENAGEEKADVDKVAPKTVIQKQEEVALEPVLAEEEEASEETTVEDVEEEPEKEERKTEWIRWLVQGKEEKFVPIKMVIVQENETIDQVAGKYEVSAEELVKTNHLTTDQLQPGQILQVPGSEPDSDKNREE